MPIGPGGPQPVAAQPRQAPLYSLIDAADLIVDAADQAGPVTTGPLAGKVDRGPKWLNGIIYRREKCGVAAALGMGCDTGDNSDYMHALSKDVDRDEDQIVETAPFVVWAGDTCSTIGWEAADYLGRAQRFLAASEAYAVEKEFWTGTQAQAGIAAGVDYPNDQWLAQSVSSTTLHGGTSVEPVYALGLLQEALGDCAGGGPGMIHMPALAFPAFQSAVDLTSMPTNGAAPNKYVDGRGNRIVPGFGYSANTGPSGAAAAAGKAWVYATSMVSIRRDDVVVVPGTYAQATDRLNNNVTFRVERSYLVDWDRCCHFAVLVDIVSA